MTNEMVDSKWRSPSTCGLTPTRFAWTGVNRRGPDSFGQVMRGMVRHELRLGDARTEPEHVLVGLLDEGAASRQVSPVLLIMGILRVPGNHADAARIHRGVDVDVIRPEAGDFTNGMST